MLCADQAYCVVPWSPQARGRLTRDWDYKSIRTETDEAYGRMFKNTTEEADKRVVDRVAEVAKARGVPRAQIALAWLLHKPVITAPIVGATKLEHLNTMRLLRARGEIVGRGYRRAGGTLCPARSGRVCLTQLLQEQASRWAESLSPRRGLEEEQRGGRPRNGAHQYRVHVVLCLLLTTDFAMMSGGFLEGWEGAGG